MAAAAEEDEEEEEEEEKLQTSSDGGSRGEESEHERWFGNDSLRFCLETILLFWMYAASRFVFLSGSSITRQGTSLALCMAL